MRLMKASARCCEVDTGIPEPGTPLEWPAPVALAGSPPLPPPSPPSVSVVGVAKLVGECGVHRGQDFGSLFVAEEPFGCDAVCEVGDVQVAAAVGVVFVGGGG